MFERFLPKEGNFFEIFEQHAELIFQAAQKLVVTLSQKQLRACLSGNSIKKIEHQADELTHQCVEMIRKTFVTPFDREDIYRLISGLDDIIDDIDAVFECLVIYKITAIHPEAIHLAKVLLQCTEEVVKTIKGLRNLKNIEEIKQRVIDIHRLENEADQILRLAIGRLFEEELDTRELIKWKEIYEIMEQATDKCEDVANLVEGILLEQS